MKNKFNIRGEITAVYVSHSDKVFECLIDTKSLEVLHEFDGTFRAIWSKNTKSFYVMGYDRSFTPKKNTMIHRYLTHAPDGLVVDHLNHDTLDNRMINLRIVSQSTNMLNPDTNKISKKNVRGVTWYEDKKKWRVRIKIEGKVKHLGYFENHEDAVKALNNK